jgi:hypothetical protein
VNRGKSSNSRSGSGDSTSPQIDEILDYSRLEQGLAYLNTHLFEQRGWIVSHVKSASSNEADVRIMSRSGAVWLEVDLGLFEGNQWPQKLSEALFSVTTLQSWLDDCDFGRFTKSELFYGIVGRIILPTRLSAPLELYGVSGSHGVAAQNHGWLTAAAIRHGLKEEQPQIQEIWCQVPACGDLILAGLPWFLQTSEEEIESVLLKIAKELDCSQSIGGAAAYSSKNPLDGFDLRGPSGVALLNELAGGSAVSIGSSAAFL